METEQGPGQCTVEQGLSKQGSAVTKAAGMAMALMMIINIILYQVLSLYHFIQSRQGH